MSADNEIYILKSKDGYRLIHAQAIENLNWWNTENKDIKKWEHRDELNPQMLSDYFDNSKVYKTEEEVLKEAAKLYNEIVEDSFWVEYGISFIRGWEDKEFPKK